MLNLFQYHSRHAEFISVSALCVVKDEILKQVQDDGVLVQDDGVWLHAKFISVSFLVMLNLFQYDSRHAEFISVSAICVVKDEILKQVQDDGVWLHTDGVLVHSDGA
jgi:hypothetical protein